MNEDERREWRKGGFKKYLPLLEGPPEEDVCWVTVVLDFFSYVVTSRNE